MEQYFNQFITPDIKVGDYIPLPEYVEKMYNRFGGRLYSGEIYKAYVLSNSQSFLCLEWDDTDGRLLKDLPSQVTLDKQGKIIELEYSFEGETHRMTGPARKRSKWNPREWFLHDLSFAYEHDSLNKFAPNQFVGELFYYLQNKPETLKNVLTTLVKRDYINFEYTIPFLEARNSYFITDELIDYLKGLA